MLKENTNNGDTENQNSDDGEDDASGIPSPQTRLLIVRKPRCG